MYKRRKEITWSGLKIGIVITIALAVLFLAILFAGNLEELITRQASVYALFEDVKGMREGAPVWFSGVEVGSVKSIEFIPGDQIKVLSLIKYDVLKYLKKDSAAVIFTQGLLGDKYMEITPGTADTERLKDGDTIAGSIKIEIQDIVRTSQDSLEVMTDFIVKLESILEKIEGGEGTVAKFLTEPAIFNNLSDAIERLSGLLNKMESGEGSFGRLVNEGTLYDDSIAALADIKEFAGAIRSSGGTLNRLIKDPAIYEQFRQASELLNDFAERLATSNGTLNKLIEDESLYDNFRQVTERLNTILESIEEEQGLMGSLINDKELTSELKSTLEELQLLLKDIKKQPGKYFKFSLF